MSLESKIGAAIESRRKIMEVLGLSEDIPFRMYAAYIAWGSDVIPATGTVFNFQKNRYAKDGQVVYLGNVSEFIRLSSATMWQDGKLVEVADNIPRISREGLLIEPQRTNLIRDSRKGQYGNSGGLILENLTGLDGVTAESRIVTVAGSNRFQYTTTLPIGTNYVIATHVLYTSIDEPRLLDVRSPVGTELEEATSTVLGVSKWGDTVHKETHSFLSSSGEQVSRLYFDNILRRRSDVGYWGWQLEVGTKQTSLIYTTGAPATRAPDILNIPLLPAQTLSGDWDEGVAYEVVDNIATFTGHGYIRNITVEAL